MKPKKRIAKFRKSTCHIFIENFCANVGSIDERVFWYRNMIYATSNAKNTQHKTRTCGICSKNQTLLPKVSGHSYLPSD